ncbi:MAG: nucleoside hydrolase [Chloroflexi bacterium]|nr:nucleoside hydrolase [Chloroflexota bacterium]
MHLDTDIGGDIDDLCALAMLLGWDGVEVVGVTTAADDRGRRAGYARRALSMAGRADVPVAAGVDVSTGCFRSEPTYPSERDYWQEPVPPLPGPADRALSLLAANIAAGAIVAAIGPYTNLAALEVREPGILGGAQLVLMGTTVVPPRQGYPAWGPADDYNVQLDANAAELVLACSDPLLVPLGPCLEAAVCRADLPALRTSGALARLVARQVSAFDDQWRNADHWGVSSAGLPDDMVNFLYDPLACAAAVGWTGVAVNPLRLSWGRDADGQLREWQDPAGKLFRVVTSVDGPEFRTVWLNAVRSV